MSLVAEGPEIRVCGRAGSSLANASARSATTWLAQTTTRWKSGTRVSAAALSGAVVQDDRVGLGDRDRAARDDPGPSGRVRPPRAAGCSPTSSMARGSVASHLGGSPSGTTNNNAYASNQYRALQQFFKWLAADNQLPDPTDRCSRRGSPTSWSQSSPARS